MPVLVCMVLALGAGLAGPGQAAGQNQRLLDLTVRPPDLHLRQAGPLEVALGGPHSLRQGLAEGEAFGEIALQAGAVGVALRPENDRVKPDLFYDLSGWRLRTRIMSGDSPLEIDGMVLRAAHALPLFGTKIGTADLP
ncbi:hypothetical protein [Geminicoccus flavidas]|uniref:hypothetical protein n=1 Tax=Geminicoccus flavidas TaxID=2506407 RepID=UPI00135AAFCE|nr:hypothetical protein [Geminicoccus flavidas]